MSGRAFLFLVGFEFFVIGHHEKYDRIDIISLNDGEIVVEVLDVSFPYEDSYDSKRAKIDINRDGVISDEELKRAGEEDALYQLIKMTLKLNGKAILLKKVKSEVRDFPRKVLENKAISIWHRFYGKIDGDVCGNFFFADNSDFNKGLIKFIVNAKCSVKQTDGIKKENYIIKELGENRRSLVILLGK